MHAQCFHKEGGSTLKQNTLGLGFGEILPSLAIADETIEIRNRVGRRI